MSHKLDLRTIARDSGMNMSRQVVGLVLGVAISVLLARGLGAEERGVYALAVLLPTVIATFLNAGVAPATVYYLGRDDYELVATVRGNIALALWLSSVGVIVGVLIVFGAADFLFPDVSQQYLLLGLLLIPAGFYNSYLLAVFQGLQDFRTFNLVTMVPQFVIIAAIAILIYGMNLGVAARDSGQFAGQPDGARTVDCHIKQAVQTEFDIRLLGGLRLFKKCAQLWREGAFFEYHRLLELPRGYILAQPLDRRDSGRHL